MFGGLLGGGSGIARGRGKGWLVSGVDVRAVNEREGLGGHFQREISRGGEFKSGAICCLLQKTTAGARLMQWSRYCRWKAQMLVPWKWSAVVREPWFR